MVFKLVAIGLAVALSILGIAIWRRRNRTQQGTLETEHTHNSRFDVRPAKASELEPLWRFGNEIFGDQISGLATMRDWYERNHKLFMIVVDKDNEELSSSNGIHGYFCVLPLSAMAANRLETGEYTAATLPPECILGPDDTAGYLYIGGIAAKSPRAKREAIARLSDYLQTYPDGTVVYARPVTEDGLQFIKTRAFVRVDHGVELLLELLYKTVIQTRPAFTRGQRKRLRRIEQNSQYERLKPKTVFFQTCVGVFQGGGCRAVAYAGAYAEAVANGVHFVEVAGTSAGSIVAVLVAAGATPRQLDNILNRLDLPSLLRRPEAIAKTFGLLRPFINILDLTLSLFPKSLPARLISVLARNGVYSSASIAEWLEKELKDLLPGIEGVVKFRDLRIPATVVATDLWERDVRVWSSETDPDEPVAAIAVRASCSIPFFFQPVQNRYVDGGTLSNLPAFVFQKGDGLNRSSLPVLAFTLHADNTPTNLSSPLGLVKSLVDVIVDGSQRLQTDMQPYLNIIEIPTGSIRATDFESLDKSALIRLKRAGTATTRDFFSNEVARFRGPGLNQRTSNRVEETYSFLADRFAEAHTSVLITADALEWIDHLSFSMLDARLRNVRIDILTKKGFDLLQPGSSRAKLLNGLGIAVHATDVERIPFEAFLFDPADSYAAAAVLLTTPQETGSHALEFFGAAHRTPIECISAFAQRLGAWEPIPQSVPTLMSCDMSPIISRLKRLPHYNRSEVEFSLRKVPVSSAVALQKYVQEFRYKQAQTLARIYLNWRSNQRNPTDVFHPTEVRNGTQLVFVLAPPVVEEVGAEYILADGAARAVYCAHRQLPEIPCIVAKGVKTALWASSRMPLKSVRVISRQVDFQDNYDDYKGAFWRDIHGVLSRSG